MDLEEKAKVFQVSCFLQASVGALRKLSKEKQLSNEEQGRLKWASELFGAVDWDSPNYKKRRGEFSSTIATTIRPYFYDAIVDGMLLQEFAFSSKLVFREFLEGFYHTLASGGRCIALSESDIRTAGIITQKMADKTLSYLQR